MKTLSIGKLRALQQCSTANGAISVMAHDHRQSLRKSLNPESPTSVMDADLSAFKMEIVSALAPHASAVLLDPEVGAGQCIAAGVIPRDIGLIVAAEETGYTGAATARNSEVLPGWTMAKAKRMGASAVKLLVYYNPDSPTAHKIEELVSMIAIDCDEAEIPLFVEPLSYSLNPAEKKLPSDERRRVVVETARRLTPLGADVLKAEFPVDVATETDESVWVEACAELSEASVVPWVLLSASVEYETFLRQVTIACQNGASGVAVGRAVWKEATSLKGEERRVFLHGLAQTRMSRMTALCDALGRPWMDFYAVPKVDGRWFTTY